MVKSQRKTSKMATMSSEFAYVKSSQSDEGCSELYGRAFEESLVEDIRSYPCLWDASDSGYKDNRMKEKAFEVLGEKYGKTGLLKQYFLRLPNSSHTP